LPGLGFLNVVATRVDATAAAKLKQLRPGMTLFDSFEELKGP
jgi:hypothetical protein